VSLKTVSQSPESHQNTFEDNNKQAKVCMISYSLTKPNQTKTNRNVNETKLTFDFEESNEIN